MPRVITSVSFDLKYDIRFTAPGVTVTFTDQGADGHETHGRVTVTDAEAAALLPAGLVDAVNAALDAKAAAPLDLPSIAARMTAVDDLERQVRTKQAMAANLDAQIAMKQVEAMALGAAAAEVQAPK